MTGPPPPPAPPPPPPPPPRVVPGHPGAAALLLLLLAMAVVITVVSAVVPTTAEQITDELRTRLDSPAGTVEATPADDEGCREIIVVDDYGLEVPILDCP